MAQSDEIQHILEWKELKQTIMALNLSIAQIDLSMTEGGYSVDTLIDSFNFMRESLDAMNVKLNNSEGLTLDEIREAFISDTAELTNKVTATIIAFQFYDKLSQRLNHVSQSLSALADIIANEEQTVSEATWNKFREKMAKYAAMREEYELFELIFAEGMSSAEAIERMKVKMRERMQDAKSAPDIEDDIELF